MALRWATLVWKMEVTLYLLLWTFWMREAVRFVVIHIIFLIWTMVCTLYTRRTLARWEQYSESLFNRYLSTYRGLCDDVFEAISRTWMSVHQSHSLKDIISTTRAAYHPLLLR